MTPLQTLPPLSPPDADEQEEAMAHDALVYELSVRLMRLDGNDGDPHQLLWCGGATPEPWGDAWQRYEPQAEQVLNAIGEGSALALVAALTAAAGVAPEGWQLVPIEPTNAMLAAARARGHFQSIACDAWTTMLAAAPAAPVNKED